MVFYGIIYEIPAVHSTVYNMLLYVYHPTYERIIEGVGRPFYTNFGRRIYSCLSADSFKHMADNRQNHTFLTFILLLIQRYNNYPFSLRNELNKHDGIFNLIRYHTV